MLTDFPVTVELPFGRYSASWFKKETVTNYHLHGFERALIEKEISEKRHYKIIEGDDVACTFPLAYKNVVIWEDKCVDNYIYIHRIATKSNFRGRSYIKKIVAWAIHLAKDKHISFEDWIRTAGMKK